MYIKPNKVALISCMQLMAELMELISLPNEKAAQLIEYVLFDKEYNGVKGKDGWGCFLVHLITERELRNLIMAHSASKIASYNKKTEPSCYDYITKNLCQKFEIALIGNVIVPKAHDILDPWEKDGA